MKATFAVALVLVSSLAACTAPLADSASSEEDPGEAALSDAGIFHYEKKILMWPDPFTPPKTKLECRKWLRLFGGKTCIGWALKKKFMEHQVDLVVDAPSVPNIEVILGECVRDSAVYSILAGITVAVATGAGGLAAAEAALIPAFKSCLVTHTITGTAGIRLRQSSHWDAEWH